MNCVERISHYTAAVPPEVPAAAHIYIYIYIYQIYIGPNIYIYIERERERCPPLPPKSGMRWPQDCDKHRTLG